MSSRRSFVSAAGAATAALAFGMRYYARAAGKPARMSPNAALDALASGNGRFIAGAPLHTEHTARREALGGGQHPFAVVLSCSDSRVPPEIVFDQGLGDLFVVRIAGNFAESDGIGSMEYAVSHFGCSLLLVLGHSSCGAVHATVDALKAHETDIPGNIADIVKALTPAATAVMSKPGDVYANTVVENVRENVAKLRLQGPILAPAVAHRALRVAGGVYDLKSGRVKFL